MIKVLLVDDEKLALEYLEHIIDWEYHGFELIGVTTNPEQALAIYKTHRPDLVISDVKMPGLNGLELGDAIREYGGNTHILFLSAYKNFDYVYSKIPPLPNSFRLILKEYFCIYLQSHSCC